MSDSEVLSGNTEAAAVSWQRWSPIPRLLPYLAACFCTSTSSGGLILGLGPFGARLVNDGYLSPDDVQVVFTGAYQIMTWGSILAVHAESRLGPRLSASFGAVIVFTGHIILGNLEKPGNPHIVMVAYGLLGWGGNHVFFSCFQFARLFPGHIGLADGLLAGLFNLAGFVFLGLNAPSLPFDVFFQIMAGVAASVLVVVVVLWPDRSYRDGDGAFISCPTVRYTKHFFTIRKYRKHLHCILNARYMLYALTFAWSSLVSTYVNGNVIVYRTSACVGDSYMKWAFPVIANPTFLFTWSIGWIIDRSGFAGVSFVLLVCCQLSLLCLTLTHDATAAWTNLVLLNWISSLQYTMEFVFLHKAVPHDAFPVGLIVVLLVQGVVGFVANPGLTPNPWGEHFVQPCLLLGLPTLPLFAWPALECRRRSRGRTGEADAALQVSPLVAGTGFRSSVLVCMESPTHGMTVAT